MASDLQSVCSMMMLKEAGHNYMLYMSVSVDLGLRTQKRSRTSVKNSSHFTSGKKSLEGKDIPNVVYKCTD